MTFPLDFSFLMLVLALGMLVWACVEVGCNDATNLVNAVFGARILKRKTAITLAGIFVILGASFASPVMDTVRKGIFDTAYLTDASAMAIFITAYLVNTVMLYAYSAYGLPVSTTATLVFSLAGGAIGATSGFNAVRWGDMGQVVAAIFISILLTGIAAFMAQRMFRGAIRKDSQKHDLVLLHGPWITGLLLVGLSWFMIVEGMHAVSGVVHFRNVMLAELGTGGLLFLLWTLYTLLTYAALFFLGKRGTRHLFQVTTILGMLCMAFAFGQNDLANCASPGLATWMIWKQGLAASTQSAFPIWALIGCGLLLCIGMHSPRAQRVTRAEINTASQQSKVRLYAPRWCIALARMLGTSASESPQEAEIRDVAPEAGRTERGKKLHYDPLRASVILAVSACVIAFASGLGLPVSTTYVTFAAVVATGWGDRVFARGRSDLKIGRAIWVVFNWLLGAGIAAIASAAVAYAILHWTYAGLALTFGLNFGLRRFFKKRADEHEEVYHHKKGQTKSDLLASGKAQLTKTQEGFAGE